MTLKRKYNRIIYQLLFVSLPMLAFGNVDVQSLFEKGNQQYAKANYAEALADYQQVLNSGYQSAELYYNVGNVYYRTDEIPSSLLFYEKAHRLSPADDDINFNIRLVNLKTIDKIDEVPEFFINRWWKGFILAFPISTIAILSVVLILLASLALIGYLFTQSVIVKKIAFYGAIGFFILGLVVIFMGNRQADYFNNHHQGIIFTSTVVVKSSPSATAKTLFILHEGTKVNELETVKNRLRIKLANGTEGWIAISDVRQI